MSCVSASVLRQHTCHVCQLVSSDNTHVICVS